MNISKQSRKVVYISFSSFIIKACVWPCKDYLRRVSNDLAAISTHKLSLEESTMRSPLYFVGFF